LLNAENDFETIFEATNGLDLLEKIHASSPDIILMDIRMPCDLYCNNMGFSNCNCTPA
jgi:YesN/AraC family two-component response regulator